MGRYCGSLHKSVDWFRQVERPGLPMDGRSQRASEATRTGKKKSNTLRKAASVGEDGRAMREVISSSFVPIFRLETLRSSTIC